MKESGYEAVFHWRLRGIPRQSPGIFATVNDTIDTLIQLRRRNRRGLHECGVSCERHRQKNDHSTGHSAQRTRKPLQVRLKILSGLAGFAVKAPQHIDGLQQRIYRQISQREKARQQRCIEHCRGTLRKNSLHAEESFEQAGYRQEHKYPVQENTTSKHNTDADDDMVLPWRQTGLPPGFSHKIRYWR